MNIKSDEQYFALKNLLVLIWNMEGKTSSSAAEASNDLYSDYGGEHEGCEGCDQKLNDCRCEYDAPDYDSYNDGDI